MSAPARGDLLLLVRRDVPSARAGVRVNKASTYSIKSEMENCRFIYEAANAKATAAVVKSSVPSNLPKSPSVSLAPASTISLQGVTYKMRIKGVSSQCMAGGPYSPSRTSALMSLPRTGTRRLCFL